MSDHKIPAPLSFALALSVVSYGAMGAGLDDPSTLLKTGGLRKLLELSESATGSAAVNLSKSEHAKTKLVQVCWSGQWRRC